MNLTPELEQFVKSRVESGLYNNQSEVVREGLRLLREQEEQKAASLAYLRGALEEGLADAREGRTKDGPAVFAAMRARLRDR